MLTLERTVIAMTTEQLPARQPTAVSQLLRAISSESEKGLPFADEQGDRFRIVVASTKALRERAYALGHRVYRACGYVHGDDGLLVHDYDARRDTFTLLIQTDAGKDIATATLVFDGSVGLPCDDIYHGELDAMRANGRRLVEVTRLCIDEDIRSRAVLVRLFNSLFIHAVCTRDTTDCVIEVNPRHVNYYQRLLSFEQLASERPCPRVKGAPAVLLHLKREIYEREVHRFASGAHAANERTLYRHFLPLAEEVIAAGHMARQCRPMSPDEAQYFGIKLPKARSALRS
jgi:hypothetical protein